MRLFIILLVCFGFSGCVLSKNSEQNAQQGSIQQAPAPKKVVTKKKIATKKTAKASSAQNTDESVNDISKTSVIVVPSVDSTKSSVEDEKYKVLNGKR